jgi:hypothetical protein
VKRALGRVTRKSIFPLQIKAMNPLAGAFMKYFPKLYEYYDITLEHVCAIALCEFPARDLPFQSFTFNVGDKSICLPHKDSENLAHGICLALPIGNFDHTKGGHIIFHELKMYIELPSGGFVLFPSSIITHQNVGISMNETRRSVTAFSSASIFRWREYGYRLSKTVSQKTKDIVAQDVLIQGKERLGHITSLF